MISEGFWSSSSKLVMTALRPSSSRGFSSVEAEVAEPGLRASGVPRGATHRAPGELSSGFIHRAVFIYATLHYSTVAGGGRG